MEWDSEIQLRSVLSHIATEIKKTINFDIAALAVNKPGSTDLQVSISVLNGEKKNVRVRTISDAACIGFKIINGNPFIQSRRESNHDFQFLDSLFSEHDNMSIRSSLIMPIEHELLGTGLLLVGSFRKELINQKHVFEEINLNAAIGKSLYKLSLRGEFEEKYAMSDNLYKMIFEKLTMPALILKKDGTILMINQALEKLYGHPLSKVSQRYSLEDLFHWQQRKNIINCYRHTSPREANSLEATFLCHNGNERFVELNISSLDDEQLLITILGDVTKYKTHEGQIEEWSDRLSLINEIMIAVNSNLNNNQLVQILFNQIGKFFGYDFAGIVVCDIEEKELDIYFSEEPNEVTFHKSAGSVFHLFQEALSGSKLIEQDAETINRISRILDLPDDVPYKSQIVIQLKTEDELKGIILLFKLTENARTQHDIEIFQSIAEPIASAIMKVQLIEKYQESLTNYSLLARVNESLNSTLDLESILRQIVESVQHVMQAKICTIRFLDEAREETHDDFLDRLKPQIKQVIIDQKPLIIENIDYNNVNFFKRKADVRRLGLKSLIVFPIIANGKTTALLSVFFDRIHSVKEREIDLLSILAHQAAIAMKNASLYHAVEQSKNFLESILKSSADVIVATDMDGKTTFFSDSASVLTGYAASEIIEQPFFGRLVKNGDSLFSGIKQMLFTTDKTLTFECEIITKDKRAIPVSWSFSILVDSNHEMIGTLGIGKDISRQKKIEADIRNQTESLKNLIYSISHNLKLPLTATMGYVSFLTSEYAHSMSDEGRDCMAHIQKNIRNLEQMVQELLDHSLTANRLESNLNRVESSDNTIFS